MKEIENAVGTPIDIDGPMRNRTFGIQREFYRILIFQRELLMKFLLSAMALLSKLRYNMSGDRCFVITASLLGMMSPLVVGYVRNHQKTRMIEGNR